MSVFTDTLKQICAKNQIPITKEQLAKCAAFYEFLREENAKYNLTAVTDEKEAALRHFYDSIAPAACFKPNAHIIDVGSGAGFPVIPILILRGDLTGTALDSTEKKCAFLKSAAERLSLRLNVVCGRAERAAREYAGRFDAAVTRAAARPSAALELCARFVKTGGEIFLYVSRAQFEDLRAENALMTLRLSLQERVPVECAEFSHDVLIFRKNAPTPEKYPRSFAKIKKSPL